MNHNRDQRSVPPPQRVRFGTRLGGAPAATVTPEGGPPSVPMARFEDVAAVRYHVALSSHEHDTAAMLAGSLAALGFTVSVAYDLEGIAALVPTCDAVVADLCSERDGRWLRHPLLTEPQRRVAIVALGAERDSEARAIAAGFDDAVALPWSAPVLAARLVNAVRARASAAPSKPHGVARLTLDEAGRTVEYAGHTARLSPMEWEIFMALVARPGTVLTRTDLIRRLYGDGAVRASRAVDVRMFHLRRKLGAPLADLLETLPGVGWRFVALA